MPELVGEKLKALDEYVVLDPALNSNSKYTISFTCAKASSCVALPTLMPAFQLGV
jgi:hypothetical protein